MTTGGAAAAQAPASSGSSEPTPGAATPAPEAPAPEPEAPSDAPANLAADLKSDMAGDAAPEVAPAATPAPEVQATETTTTETLSAVPGEVAAPDAATSVSETASTTAEKPWNPMRGSMLTYRNVITAISLSRNAESTYNPYYAMGLRASPVWWFNDYVNVWGDLYVAGELTTSNTSNDDLFFALDPEFGAEGAYTIPVVGIDLSLSLSMTLPLTKASQLASLVTSINSELGAGYTIPVMGGLTVDAAFSFSKYVHNYTTSGAVGELGGACAIEQGVSCGSGLIYSGERNPEYGMGVRGRVSMKFTDWISASTSVTALQDTLYGSSLSGGISNVVANPVNSRAYLLWTLGVKVTPLPLFSVALGTRSYYPQLGSDGTYRTPFFNRFTQIYLDLILNPGEFFTLAAETGEEA